MLNTNHSYLGLVDNPTYKSSTKLHGRVQLRFPGQFVPLMVGLMYLNY